VRIYKICFELIEGCTWRESPDSLQNSVLWSLTKSLKVKQESPFRGKFGRISKESRQSGVLPTPFFIRCNSCGFILKVVIVPLPFWDSTWMSPPSFSIIFLQIERPSPLPSRFKPEASSPFPNSLNKFAFYSSVIPIPVS